MAFILVKGEQNIRARNELAFHVKENITQSIVDIVNFTSIKLII